MFGPYRGMLDCSGLLLGILSRHVSCLNRIKNAIERVQTLPTRSHKKSSSKSHPVWLRSGGSKRCHLPVICLGKTRRNPNINSELMFGFSVVFYRETKWPKWPKWPTFRVFGGSQDVTGSAVMMSWERTRDFSGAALQTQSIGTAKRKHR